MIIWFKPNDLVRDKWLFGSSQMIWFKPNDYWGAEVGKIIV